MRKFLIIFLILAIGFFYFYYQGIFERKIEISLNNSIPLETSPKKLNSKNIIDVSDAFKFLLNKSRKSIYIAGLYFTSNIDWRIKRDIRRAIKRGVHFKFLLQDSDFSKTEFSNLGLSKYTNVEVRFIDISKLGNNKWGDFHNKYAIFDERYAILGSANFSYPAFYNNVEINGLLVETNIVRKLVEIFLKDFNYAKNKVIHTQFFSLRLDISNLFTNKIFLVETAPSEINSPEIPDNSEVIEYILKNSKKEILLEIYAFTSNETNFPILFNLIKDSLKRNVEVKILIDKNNYDTKLYIKDCIDELCKLGCKVKKLNIRKASGEEFSAVHSKLLIVDRKYVLFGSCNWTKAGMQENRELSVVTTYTEFVNKFNEKFLSDFNSKFSEEVRCDK